MSDTLQPFFKQISRDRLLTRDEEVHLSQLIEKGDKHARDKMIKSNLRLAISIAKKYQDRGCDLPDLIQESSLGLMKAVDRFDWRRGFKFSTYACWWIKQTIRRHIASQSNVVRMPTYTRNMIWKINQAIVEYEHEFGQKPTTTELAELLNISEEIVESTIRCNTAYVTSFDMPIDYGSGDSTRSLSDVIGDDNLPDPDSELDKTKVMQIIRSALSSLSPREEKIMRLRFGISESITDHNNFPITHAQLAVLHTQSKKGA